MHLVSAGIISLLLFLIAGSGIGSIDDSIFSSASLLAHESPDLAKLSLGWDVLVDAVTVALVAEGLSDLLWEAEGEVRHIEGLDLCGLLDKHVYRVFHLVALGGRVL